MAKIHASSVQEFGVNKFVQQHAHASDANFGMLVPIMWADVPFGSTIENSIDFFTRSSPLVDPAFLDADISVAHYFVSHEALDPFFKSRLRDFRRTQQDTPLTQLFLTPDDIGEELETDVFTLTKGFAPGSLLDRLGLQLIDKANGVGATTDLYLWTAPLFAYHMICDWFFTSRNMQNPYRTSDIIKQLITLDQTSFSLPQWDAAAKKVDAKFNSINDASKKGLLDIRTCNFEPDYFTSCRPKAGGPDVYLPGTTENPAPATIRNLLDAQLLQKISDMLYKGGYSYDDFCRILYGFEPGERDCEEPIYLGGSTAPLQVSTVVQSVGTDSGPLGTQAGTVTAYAQGGNHVKHFALRSGIYMAIAFIRPKVYYKGYIDRNFLKHSVADFLIPQLADASDEPIMLSEVSGHPAALLGNNGGPIFGYNDRYESYRTRVNRATSSIRTTRSSWILSRKFIDLTTGSPEISAISPDFLSMQDQADYSPWVVTDPNQPHFFFRANCQYIASHLLPARSKPFVW